MRTEWITKLNQVNIFVDKNGDELQGSPFLEVKRTYALHLIREGLNPDGTKE